MTEFLAVVLACLIAILASAPASARAVRELNNTPAQKEWFRAATGDNGGSCCDEADGFREGIEYPWYGGTRIILEAWDMRDDGYWAKITGQWIRIGYKNIVLKNPLGLAVIWLMWPQGFSSDP